MSSVVHYLLNFVSSNHIHSLKTIATQIHPDLYNVWFFMTVDELKSKILLNPSI